MSTALYIDMDEEQTEQTTQDEVITCPVCDKPWDLDDPDCCEYFKRLETEDD